MNPRRSSRAVIAGTGAQPTNSSNPHSRAERSTRAQNKRETSSAQRSESRDDSANRQDESLTTRRSKRGVEVDNDDGMRPALDGEEEEDAEAEEVTRCVCGLAEYPGPPVASRETGLKVSRANIKDENSAQSPIVTEGLPEDAGNFFIQCDKCQVWQHGGCIGLMDEATSPDEYFCEQCKPSLHKIIRGSNGTRSTRYLPVLEAAPPRSSSTSSNEAVRRKDSKLSAKDATTRRRATMNSREAAYDEEEMMRRAIEESKMTSGSLGKRSRDEIDDQSNNPKRLRTASDSPEPQGSPSPSQPASDDEDDSRLAVNGNSRRGRNGAARGQKEKDSRDKQKEAEKQKREEAAGRRNARSERRRGEDTPPPTPSLSPSKHESKNAMSSAQKGVQPDTSSTNRPSSMNNHRKTGRPARRGRIRNQYTRDAEINGEDSPMRDLSKDGQGSPQGANGTVNGESGRPSRPKYMNPTRTSLNEMKRRVAGIIEFVSRLQTEIPSSPNNGTSNTSNGTSSDGAVNTNGVPSPDSGDMVPATSQKNFREMASPEMMEELMKGAVTWQASYGKYGEK